MKTLVVSLLAVIASLDLVAQPVSEGERHGQFVLHQETSYAWDRVAAKWVSPETFWLNHARRNGGLRWGYADHYPPYSQVRENDLIVIESPDGICLMEFFHQRWRRANDVRRWDRRFNDYGGCANVHRHQEQLLAPATSH